MATAETESLIVEVAYADVEEQHLLELRVAAGSTVADALELAEAVPAAARAHCAVGVWGRLVSRSQVLGDGDRVELYRELEVDPRDGRRARAAAKRSARTVSARGGSRVPDRS